MTTTNSSHAEISLSVSDARFKMIEQQIRPWNVSDQDVLEVLNLIKREQFVAESQVNLAFTDTQLPILGSDQKMFEPKVEARVLQAVKPNGMETVLEIGTGSAYMAALLGYFAKHVTSVEINPSLVPQAIENLNKSHIPNVTIEVGDAAHGWKTADAQTYDVICVSGGLPKVSDTLRSQLNVGGRLFAFVGDDLLMNAVLITRISHDFYQTKTLFETVVPMLKVTKAELENFVF